MSTYVYAAVMLVLLAIGALFGWVAREQTKRMKSELEERRQRMAAGKRPSDKKKPAKPGSINL